MASRVNIVHANILDNPAMFTDKFKLEITFEVFEQLPHDLEWELVYVGSGASREYDQVLDSVLVGPVREGRHKFVFEAGCPDVSKIPQDDIVGVSVLLLRCKYNEQEFINLGWFVANEYSDEELKANPPTVPQVDKLVRKVEIDDLRVTTFPITWNEADAAAELPEVEPERVFTEDDLMPATDDGDDDDDDEEDDEDEDDNAKEVDLNESFNEKMAATLEGMDMDHGDCGEEKKEEEQGVEDVAMEDDNVGDDDAWLQINNDKQQQSTDEPLGDKTNNKMIE